MTLAGVRDSAVPVSVLELAMVQKGATAREALLATAAVAGHIERLGYRRLWLAEHHGTEAIASFSPPVMVGQIAAVTSTLRVGSGGVMVPNHVPLVIAEQFATLDAFHPGRIDLGMGRGPGTLDQDIARALRRGAGPATDEEYQQDVRALLDLLDADADVGAAELRNHETTLEPWLLSSSVAGAGLAGRLGLPVAIAHHIRPDNTEAALAEYREAFRPSARLSEPYVMLCLETICAATDEQARYLAGPSEIAAASLAEGKPFEILTPEDAAAYEYSDSQQRILEYRRRSQVKGSPDTVARRVAEILSATGANELMLYTPVYDLAARLRSHELVAGCLATAA